MKNIKLTTLLLSTLALMLSSHSQAHEGSWLAAGANYENLASGITENGYSLGLEGGYWYLGNVAYGGYFKTANFGEIDGRGGSSLKTHEFGGFLKAATEAGLYGKLHTGIVFINANGNTAGLRVPDGTSWSIGLGGGFLIPVTESFQVGPEVIYRHLTAGNGGDQVSIGLFVAYGF